MTNYWYDADGERTVKTSGEGEQLYVNSEFAGGRTNTAKFSLYVSPYLVANQGGRYTKHIYIGSQRIVSKIGDFASYGSDPRRIQYAGSETDGLSVNYKQKYSAQQQVIKDNYAIFEVPYNGTDNNDYVDGQGFCCDDGSPEAAQARALALENNFQDPDAYEKLQFYYHPDHLGSSSYITNLDGEVVQHIEYVPFGEVFIEERNSIWNTPYLFNAKEFDEETGLYYYGARYYDPRLSLWMSTDPMQEKYYNLTSYHYCFYNPTRYIDLNGLDGFDKIVGYTIGTITNIIPFSSELRDLYTPTSREDYNSALRNTDYTMLAFGSNLTKFGGGAIAVGSTIVIGGLTATASTGGTIIIVGGSTVAIGITIGEAGSISAATGAMLMSNSTLNKEQGYDRGKKSNVSSGNKNSQHANQHRKSVNKNNYEQLKKEYERLNSLPNKTKEIKAERDKIKKQMDRARDRMNFSGENHSRNSKGNR